ncbi:MAG: hypothetical protein LBQ88_14770, partial [Treponema sp.]|nr:hypothetical protein [Treponema sp.]
MKTTCFTPKPPCFGLVFAAALTLAGLVSSCVKPIGFPIDIKAQLTGEIGIDNINSAEIQFINHTKSMDIEKIEITRLLLGEDETAPYGLDSRLLGGPHAGTKESVLLRPIGTNAMATITTLAYEIEISYRKATAPVPVEASNKSVFERLKTESGEGSIKFGKGQAGDMAVLPRGKTIVHFYRAANGDIELQVSDPTGDANSVDYVQNVTVVDSGGGVNLNNLEVKLTSLPAVTVDFSDGVKKMIRDLHIKVTDVEKAVNNVAANTLTVAKVIADAILSGSSPYGNNYSLLLIQNWTARTAAVKLSQKYSFNGSTFQTDLNFGSLGQMSSGLGQQYAVLKNGAWDAGVDINGVTISYPNIVLPAQKYLHIYEKTFGHNIYASEQEFGALLAGNVLIDINQKYRSNEYKYGRIEVQNYSSAELAGIGFLKRDDPSTKFVIQDITKGKGKTRDQVSGAPNAEMFNPGKSMSDGVLAGDYFITVLTKGGSIVMQDHATTIKAEAFTSGNDNKIYIFEDDITVIPPVIINWTVSANGGPPAAQNQAAYTTTLLTFTFDSAPGNSIKFTKSGGTAAVGPLTKVDAKTFTMAVTTSVETQESLFFTTATANVAPGPKG